MANQAPIQRRDPLVPLQFKKIRYSDDDSDDQDWLGLRDEEDEGRTMDERLMMPSSVRRLCPELQELFFLSTSNNYSLPFPLKDPVLEAARHSVPPTPQSALKAATTVLTEEAEVSMYNPDAYPEDQAPMMNEGDFPFEDYNTGSVAAAAPSPYDTNNSFSNDNDRTSFPLNETSENIRRALDLSQSALDTQLLASQQSVKDADADDKQLNERTKAVLSVLEEEFKTKVSVTLQDITSGVSKRTAASCFMEILQLKTRGMIGAVQTKPFGEITLLPGQ